MKWATKVPSRGFAHEKDTHIHIHIHISSVNRRISLFGFLFAFLFAVCFIWSNCLWTFHTQDALLTKLSSAPARPCKLPSDTKFKRVQSQVKAMASSSFFSWVAKEGQKSIKATFCKLQSVTCMMGPFFQCFSVQTNYTFVLLVSFVKHCSCLLFLFSLNKSSRQLEHTPVQWMLTWLWSSYWETKSWG